MQNHIYVGAFITKDPSSSQASNHKDLRNLENSSL